MDTIVPPYTTYAHAYILNVKHMRQILQFYQEATTMEAPLLFLTLTLVTHATGTYTQPSVELNKSNQMKLHV